jgi:hypothetical protein
LVVRRAVQGGVFDGGRKMSSFQGLNEVAATLRSTVGEAVFGPVSTRVLLRTGVNLRKPRPDQIKDPVALGKVLTALLDMGYRL